MGDLNETLDELGLEIDVVVPVHGQRATRRSPIPLVEAREASPIAFTGPRPDTTATERIRSGNRYAQASA